MPCANRLTAETGGPWLVPLHPVSTPGSVKPVGNKMTSVRACVLEKVLDAPSNGVSWVNVVSGVLRDSVHPVDFTRLFLSIFGPRLHPHLIPHV